MSIVVRKYIPLALVFIMGVLMLGERYISILNTSTAFTDITFTIQRFGMIITAFTLGMGLAAVLRLHLTNIRTKNGPWYLSIWLIIVMGVFIGIGLPYGTDSDIYLNLSKWLLEPPSYSIIIDMFMLVYGIFWHVFIRNRGEWEKILFGIIFGLTLIGSLPVGGAIWPGFIDIARWIEKVPDTAGTRAWMVLMAIGTATTGIRVILGREPRVLGVE